MVEFTLLTMVNYPLKQFNQQMKKNSVSKSLGIEAPWKIIEDAYSETEDGDLY